MLLARFIGAPVASPRARIVGGRLRFEKNGSTEMAAWYRLDEVVGLQRVRLVDIALGMAGLTG